MPRTVNYFLRGILAGLLTVSALLYGVPHRCCFPEEFPLDEYRTGNLTGRQVRYPLNYGTPKLFLFMRIYN